MDKQYNLRSPAVKRLMREAQELRQPTELFYTHPLEDNLFEWHFTIRGPADTSFEGGIYHGRIVLPPDYPMKPPSILLLTPNGRFETHKKICLSISGHHPESWQPSWSIRTALLAIIGFMPTHGNGAIGSLDYTAAERKLLSKKSLSWRCTDCGDISNLLLPVTEASKEEEAEAKHLAAQIDFKGEKGDKAPSTDSTTSEPTTDKEPVTPQQSEPTSPLAATSLPTAPQPPDAVPVRQMAPWPAHGQSYEPPAPPPPSPVLPASSTSPQAVETMTSTQPIASVAASPSDPTSAVPSTPSTAGNTRRRVVSSAATNVVTTTQSAEPRPPPATTQQTDSRLLMVFTALIGLALAVLVARRILMMAF